MSFLVFAVFCLVLLLAAYTVVRARRRNLTCLERVRRIRRLSDQDVEGRIPARWDGVVSVCRTFHNLGPVTEVADWYQRAMVACTDDDFISNMQLVHRTFVRKRRTLLRDLMLGLWIMCTGRIGKRNLQLATIAKHYEDILLLAQEMAELIDPRCAALLEGQLLHGS